MLKEIRCDLFRDSVITFNEGLNVVLGDQKASNSIGKSTMLMIIDFVFGGDSYIKTNYDAIVHLGHHEFRFKHEFKEESLYFIRKTDRYKFVSCCDEDYEVISEISNDEYKLLIKEKYAIDLPFISFRDIVGLYSRIWGKKNYDIDKPLQQIGVNAKNAVDLVIKMFGKYSGIKAFDDQITDLADRKNAIQNAAKKDYLPNVTQTIYKNNFKTIESIKREIKAISADIQGLKTDADAIVSKEVLELKHSRSILLKKKNLYEDRLAKTIFNISAKSPTLKTQLSRLTEYFPNIDMDKLNTVDTFHSDISAILKSELKSTEKELEQVIKSIEDEILKIDAEMDEKLNLKDTPKYTVDRLVELAAHVSQLEKANELFEKKETIDKNLTSAKKDLAEIKTVIISDINSMLNNAMYELNKKINTDGRRSPVIELKENNYDFRVFDDTGTGKAYTSLITLDLVVLQLTQLPVLVHDTMLFKNIENNVFENFVGIYCSQSKQVFIAIDEIGKFKKETEAILEKKAVLHLAYDKTLFIKDWKKDKEENNNA